MGSQSQKGEERSGKAAHPRADRANGEGEASRGGALRGCIRRALPRAA